MIFPNRMKNFLSLSDSVVFECTWMWNEDQQATVSRGIKCRLETVDSRWTICAQFAYTLTNVHNALTNVDMYSHCSQRMRHLVLLHFSWLCLPWSPLNDICFAISRQYSQCTQHHICNICHFFLRESDNLILSNFEVSVDIDLPLSAWTVSDHHRKA